MVKPKGILEDLIAEIGLQNSNNIFTWLLAGFLLLIDLYFWTDLFNSFSLANFINISRYTQNPFAIVDSCQTVFDLIGLAEFLIQLSAAIFANYLLLGNSTISLETKSISIAPKYNNSICNSCYLMGQCSKKSYLTGLICS